jgi:hypothetical protein
VRNGSREKAEAVYKSGIAKKARPVNAIEDAYNAFLAKVPAASGSTPAPVPAPTSAPSARKPAGLAVPEPDPPGSRSLTSSASDTFLAPGPGASADARAAYKRLTYMRQHMRTGGAPAPGKRREVLQLHLPAIFTPAGAEFCFEEARARHLGLLDKAWPPPEPWEFRFRAAPPAPAPAAAGPSVKFAEAVTTHAAAEDASFASTVSPPPSPGRAAAAAGGAFDSRTTVLRRMGAMGAGFGAPAAEPTMTINTKESLADVYGMMNSPEKPLRAAAAPGSKYAPVRRVAAAGRAPALTSLAALTESAEGAPFEDDAPAPVRYPKSPVTGAARPAFTPCMSADARTSRWWLTSPQLPVSSPLSTSRTRRRRHRSHRPSSRRSSMRTRSRLPRLQLPVHIEHDMCRVLSLTSHTSIPAVCR